MGFMSRREAPLQGFGYGDVVHQQDLGRQTVDIYVLKTMIYCINQVSLRKSWEFSDINLSNIRVVFIESGNFLG